VKQLKKANALNETTQANANQTNANSAHQVFVVLRIFDEGDARPVAVFDNANAADELMARLTRAHAVKEWRDSEVLRRVHEELSKIPNLGLDRPHPSFRSNLCSSEAFFRDLGDYTKTQSKRAQITTAVVRDVASITPPAELPGSNGCFDVVETLFNPSESEVLHEHNSIIECSRG